MAEWILKLFIKDYRNNEDPAVRTACGSLAGRIGLSCNLLLVAGKLFIGLISGSIAIMADALNNLSDAVSSIMTLVGFRMSGKRADREHPFGHARYEYIAGLIVAILVLLIGIELGKSSIGKIIAPTPVSFNLVTFVVLVMSVAIKAWMAFFYRGVGRHIHSATLQAACADSRNDVITTSAVLLAAAVARFTGLNLDGWMGLGVSVFIVFSGIGLVKDTLSPLLGEAPSPQLVKSIADKIAAYDGVLGTHDLIVHDYGPGRLFASTHVEMSSAVDAMVSHDIIDRIERDFLQNENIQLIIHYDPVATGENADRTRAWVEEQVRAVDSRLTIHDLRLTQEDGKTCYVFDAVAPQDIGLSDSELIARIEAHIRQSDPAVRVAVTIDSLFTSTL